MEMEYKLGPFVRCVRIGPKDLDGVGQEAHKAWGGWGAGELGKKSRHPQLYLLLVTASPGSDRQLPIPSPPRPLAVLPTPHDSSLTATPFTMQEEKTGPHGPQKASRTKLPRPPTVTCHGTATGTGTDTRDPGVVTGPFPACSRLRLKIGPPILLLTFLPSHGECVGGCINMDERWEILGCSASSVIGRPFAACVLIAR